jgi:DMSO/TMAO reductase YedYZ molybdopterin-dependent catalytic subunit
VNDRAIGRAAFLGLLGAGVAGLFYGRDVTGLLGRIVPDGVTSLVPSSGWRIYTVASEMPDLDPATYRLRIDGLVERPVTYTLDDLRSLPRAEQVSDFHCVTGWSVRDVHWAGVRFEHLLAEAKPLPGAFWYRFVSAEVPYDDILSFEQVFLPDVMLAYEMDGKPLARAHGAPVRVVMPRMYGYKYVKWVDRIDVRREFRPGFWEQRGYDSDAWVGGSNGR